MIFICLLYIIFYVYFHLIILYYLVLCVYVCYVSLCVCLVLCYDDFFLIIIHSSWTGYLQDSKSEDLSVPLVMRFSLSTVMY